MSAEPDNLVLQLLRGIRAEVAETKSELKSLRADVASDLATLRAENEAAHKATREQVVGLRRAVIEYHSAVIGHGILISELEARLRRVEQHLNLSSGDAH